MRKRVLFAAVIGVPVILLVIPAVALAAGPPDAMAVFQAILGAILDAGRDAYCAAGITAFCP